MVAITGNSTILVRDYNTKEIITILENANYEVSFSERSIAAGRNFAGYSSFEPIQISVHAKSLSQSAAAILYKKDTTQKELKVPVSDFLESDSEGSIFLPQIISEESDVISVVDTNHNIISPDIDVEVSSLTGLDPNTFYTITYLTEIYSFESYRMDQKDYSYVSLEITNTGNAAGNGMTMFMRVPKATLSVSGGLTFDKLSTIGMGFTFNIINTEVEIFYY